MRLLINLAAAEAFNGVMALVPLIGGLLVLTLLVTAVLGALVVASRSDESTKRQWDRLGHMHSATGIAFFPTRKARVELEAAMADAVRLARRR